MRVALYGSSLFIEGLEESLKADPGLEVLRLRGDAKDVLSEAGRLQPDAVVLEAGTLPDGLGMMLLKECQGLMLVVLDQEKSDLFLLSGQQARAETTMDLLLMLRGHGQQLFSDAADTPTIHGGTS
jgi:DNA-binding NarL/FixJ family response regulator